MHANLKSILSLALTGVIFTACAPDQIEIPKSELYAREFIKQFGVVDPNHTWSAAQKVNVTVQAKTPTDVRIIADHNGKTYLFGDFKNVSGTQNLTFDLPVGATNLVVRANGRDYKLNPNGSVSISGQGSRAFIENESNIVWATKDEYMIFPVDVIKAYVSDEPDENGGYVGEVPEGKNNLNNPTLTENFWMVSQGPFVTYPIYWQSNYNHVVGIYYIPEGKTFQEGIHVPFFKDKKFSGGCDDLQGSSSYSPAKTEKIGEAYIYFTEDKQPLTNADGTYVYNNWEKNNNLNVGDTLDGKIITSVDSSEDLTKCDDNTWVNNVNVKYKKTIYYYTTIEANYGTWSNVGFHTSDTYNQFYRSQAFTINVPTGSTFCFYIDIYTQDTESEVKDKSYLEGYRFIRRVYSSAKMNELSGILPHTDDQTKNANRKYSWAVHKVATVKTKVGDGEEKEQDYTYWSFEDYGGRSQDEEAITSTSEVIDLNDIIWVIASDYPPEKPYTPPTVTEDPDPDPKPKPDPDPFSWIVACEDLGGTYDHDFNDVVFGVQYVSGQEYAYVTALAAGGTIPVRLFYNGNPITGGDDPDGEQYTVVPARDGRTRFNSWNEWFGRDNASEVINATGFEGAGATVRIKVGEKFTMSNGPQLEDTEDRFGRFHVEVAHNEGTTQINPPSQTDQPGTNIPQMFVTTSNFKWPQERNPIYSTHRGDITSGKLEGTTPGNSYHKPFEYFSGGFHAWVKDQEANKHFHTIEPSGPGLVVNHTWNGTKIPKTETKE